MSKRGPKPTPTVLKIARGNPGRRPLNKREPNAARFTIAPTAPDYLGDVGKKEWRRMAKELVKMKVLTKVSLAGLGAYCGAFEVFTIAYKSVLEDGTIMMNGRGQPVQNPNMRIATAQQDAMRKWLSEFGATPSSMTRVQLPKEDKTVDPLAEFLK